MRRIIAMIALACASVAHAEPRRIVSLDYCADQFVLALADRVQIAALSRGSQRDDSYYRMRAHGIRQTRGALEEVLALRPDLVVRNWGGPWDAEQVYARFSIPVLQVGDTPDFVSARSDLIDAAQALGHPERGQALAHDLDLRLAHLHVLPPDGRGGPRPALRRRRHGRRWHDDECSDRRRRRAQHSQRRRLDNTTARTHDPNAASGHCAWLLRYKP